MTRKNLKIRKLRFLVWLTWLPWRLSHGQFKKIYKEGRRIFRLCPVVQTLTPWSKD